MMSYTQEKQCPGFKELIGDRDLRFGVDHETKGEKRAYIMEPDIHEGMLREAVLLYGPLTVVLLAVDADSMWKQ